MSLKANTEQELNSLKSEEWHVGKHEPIVDEAL